MAAPAPATANADSGISGVPATKSNDNTMAPITSVVPRLGWSINSAATPMNTTVTGRNVR